MKIIIDKEYFVLHSTYEYMLMKNTKTKDGKLGVSTIGHFSKLLNTLKRVVELQLAEQEDTVSLEEYLIRFNERLNKFEEQFNTAYETIFKNN